MKNYGLTPLTLSSVARHESGAERSFKSFQIRPVTGLFARPARGHICPQPSVPLPQPEPHPTYGPVFPPIYSD
jgi:hypothetical protein